MATTVKGLVAVNITLLGRGTRRRMVAGLALAAISAGVGTSSFAFRSDAAAPPGGYEPATLADTNYAIPSGAYFVSNSGSDTNAGTAGAPLLTVAKALAVAPSGGTIVLRGGTYREALVMKRSVTLQAYPHEQPWIVGSDVMSGFAANGTAWTHPFTDALCDSCFSATVIDPAYPAAGLPEQVFVDGVPLDQVTALSALVPGTFFADKVNSMLYLGSDPTGHAVEVTTRPTALTMQAAATGAAVKGIGFARTGSTFDSTAGAMVQNSAPGAVFDHDTFAWSASRGLNDYAINTVVTGNLFLYNGSNGFHAHMADGLAFKNNRVAWSNQEHFSITPSPYASEGGAKITHTWNGTVVGNLFDDNGANGLWFDVTSTYAVIADNTVLRNAGHGIAYEISGPAVIAGNVIAQNGRVGLKVSGVSGAQVWNNTIVGNGMAQMGVYEDPRTDTTPADNAVGITYDTANVEIVNNVLVAAATSTRPVFESFDTSSPRHLTTSQMISVDDHNLWSRQAVTAPKFLISWGSLTGATRYTTLAAAQLGTGREASSVAADNVPWSALFTDPANNDFSALAGSPLMQPGATLPPAVAAAMGVTSQPTALGAPHMPPPIPPVTTTTLPPTTTTTLPPTTTTTLPPTTTTTVPPTTTTTLPPLPTVSVADASMPEGPLNVTGKIRLTITLSKPSASDVSVNFSSADGTALAGSDYRSRGGAALFPAGTTTFDVYVKVIGDNTKEPNETFSLNLAGAVGATIADGRAIATIVNDD